jgi:hypothetical protein
VFENYATFVEVIFVEHNVIVLPGENILLALIMITLSNAPL